MDLCLIYFSSAPDLTPPQLEVILHQSRTNNALKRISGVLLYVRGNIIQVLEGEAQSVMNLFERIRQDPRHRGVDLVTSRPISTRTFGEWSMGYQTLTSQQLQEVQTLVDLDRPDGLGSRPSDPILLRTLKLFYESNQIG